MLTTSNEPVTQRDLSFGEKAVGITFNPGGIPEVNLIKENCALIIDQLQVARLTCNNQDKARMYSEAITAIQTGQMWAVKAATWQY